MYIKRQHILTAGLPWLTTLFAALAMPSCGNGSEPNTDPVGSRDVYIQAAVGNKSLSRGPYEAGAPSVDTPLDAVVWATPTSHSYTSATGDLDELTVETKVLFLSGKPQLIKGIQYPADKEPLFFVAMHPETGWTSETGNVAYRSFTGCEDLLFAKETSGSYGDTNNLPRLEFRHLLTQLCVKVRAEDEEASEAWGKLESLTVKSHNRASIPIGTDEPSPYFEGTETDFNFFVTGTDNVFPGDDDTLPFDGTKKEAYVLCAPITINASEGTTDGTDTTGQKYIIILKTENRTVKQTVEMTDIGTEAFAGGSTMGHKFTLDICLKLGYNITTETTVDKWVYGGSASTTVDQ